MVKPDTHDDPATCKGCGAPIPAHEQGKGRHPYLCYMCSRTPRHRERYGGANGDGTDAASPPQGRWRAVVCLRSGPRSIIAACDTHRGACEALAAHVEALPPYVTDRIRTTEAEPAP